MENESHMLQQFTLRKQNIFKLKKEERRRKTQGLHALEKCLMQGKSM